MQRLIINSVVFSILSLAFPSSGAAQVALGNGVQVGSGAGTGGTPGGSTTQIQYNNAGSFGGDAYGITDGAGNETFNSITTGDNCSGCAAEIDFGAGTSPTGSTPANTLRMYAPASITPYDLVLPIAAPTSGNTYLSCTPANPAICSWAAGGGGAFTGGLGSSYQDVAAIPAPVNPGAGIGRVYVDSTTGRINCINSTGGTCMPLNSDAVRTTVTGTSAGSAVWSMPQQGTSWKQTIIYLNGYENTTATAQTITLPASFATVGYVVADGGSCAGVTISATTITLPSSMSATQTGLCEVKGY